MVCLMEVFGGVLGWVEVFGVFWTGRSRFWLVPIGDFDITWGYVTRREMSRNVEKCRVLSKNVEVAVRGGTSFTWYLLGTIRWQWPMY